MRIIKNLGFESSSKYPSGKAFVALVKCGHCGYECQTSAYDDDYYHHKAVPKLICQKCKKDEPLESSSK